MNFFAVILCALAAASMATISDCKPEIPVTSLTQMSLSKFFYLVGLEMSNIDGIIKLKRSDFSNVVFFEVCPQLLRKK